MGAVAIILFLAMMSVVVACSSTTLEQSKYSGARTPTRKDRGQQVDYILPLHFTMAKQLTTVIKAYFLHVQRTWPSTMATKHSPVVCYMYVDALS